MERLPDLLRVPLAAVIHHARSANYFQVRDSCECSGFRRARHRQRQRRLCRHRDFQRAALRCLQMHVPARDSTPAFQPPPTARSTMESAAPLVGLRCTHFLPRMAIPMHRSRIGSCFSQRSKSSPSTRADEYRRCGFFSRHLRQIVEKSRSILRFHSRGCRGSVSSSSRMVS
jgi:hypothetical protein